MALIHTFTEQKLEPYKNPDLARTTAVKFGNSLTVAKGTVVARKTSDNKFYAYLDSNSDGTEVARGIAQYDFVTDASGNVFLGAAATSEHGQYELTAPIYTQGEFFIGDLTGLDANGLADLQGRLIEGDSVSDTTLGVIHF